MVAEAGPEVGVIAAKLVPPRRPLGVVSRPHLLELLDSGKGHALTLLSAPAGFGKTTLLTQWVDSASPDTRFAWVSLDAGDAEALRLWTHVIAAVGRSRTGFGSRSLAALRANPTRIVEAMLPVLFDELAAEQEELVLVLDDYHLAQTGHVDEQVRSFLAYRPAQVQVVIATRSDPALGIARLRASGELVEVRADSLRFGRSELAPFFEGIGVTGLSGVDLDLLDQRTGGWPAPLRLAALLIPEHGRDAFISSFTGESRTVVDYLTADVLDLLEPDTRDFLLKVSVLRRMNGPLCDAVTASSGSGDRLAALERANLFLSIDSEGGWYHQHQLFAEALRFELSRTRPELLASLHSRAARWLATNGDLETATEHAIASRDVALASGLIAGQLQWLVSTGRTAIVRQWLVDMSWPEARQDPGLAFVRAVSASLENRYDDAVSFLDVARTGPLEQVDAAGLSLGFRVDFFDGLVAVSHVSRAHESARRAVGAAPSPAWEGVALAGVGQAQLLQDRPADAVQTLRRAVSMIPDTSPLLLAVAVGSLGLAEAEAGDGSSRAAPMLRPLLDVMASIGAGRTVVAAVLHLAVGAHHGMTGEHRAADASFTTACAILQESPPGTWRALAHLLRAQSQRALGEVQAALASVAAADEILDRLPDPGGLRIRSTRVATLTTAPTRVTASYGERLSERELAVLRLASSGIEQRQIAEQLFISYNTVKSHLKTSYRKLGVSSRAAALERLRVLESGTGDAAGPHPGERHGEGSVDETVTS